MWYQNRHQEFTGIAIDWHDFGAVTWFFNSLFLCLLLKFSIYTFTEHLCIPTGRKERAREVKNKMRAIRWWIIFFYTSSMLTNDCREHKKGHVFWIQSMSVCLYAFLCVFTCEGGESFIGCVYSLKIILYLSQFWVIVIFGFIVRGSLDEIQGFLLFLILTYICK